MVVLGGVAVAYERGTPVGLRVNARSRRARHPRTSTFLLPSSLLLSSLELSDTTVYEP